MADLNFTAEIAGLKARNAELIQKIAEDEANLNQESFEKEFRPRRGTPRTVHGQIKSQIDQFLKLSKFFLLIMGALVMFMQCGFAFLEAGAVRSKVIEV